MDVRNKCQGKRRERERQRGETAEIKRLKKIASQGSPHFFLAPSARKP